MERLVKQGQRLTIAIGFHSVENTQVALTFIKILRILVEIQTFAENAKGSVTEKKHGKGERKRRTEKRYEKVEWKRVVAKSLTGGDE